MEYDIVRFNSGGFAVRVTRRELLIFKVYSYIDVSDGQEWYSAGYAHKYCVVDTYKQAMELLNSTKRQHDLYNDVGEVVSGPH